MFTVKHVKQDGSTAVCACISYQIFPVNDLGKRLPQLALQGESGMADKLFLDYGEVVYVENIKGKTIDVVRASRE